MCLTNIDGTLTLYHVFEMFAMNAINLTILGLLESSGRNRGGNRQANDRINAVMAKYKVQKEQKMCTTLCIWENQRMTLRRTDV